MAGLDEEGARACVDYSLIELARTGTTTVVQMGGHEEYAADAIEASGLRGYVAPMYRSGRWFTPDGKRVDYAWDADDGRSGFEAGVGFVERLRGRADGRVQGLLAPAQVDTCSEALLRDSRAAVRRPRGPALAARLAGRLGVPGDDQAPRPDAGGVALRHRLPRPADAARPRGLRQPATRG